MKEQNKSIKLGVNVDHVASLRSSRGTMYPDPVYAALIAQEHGADGITVHLREDRRHIIERDLQLLISQLQVPLNLEMALTDEMLNIALEISPLYCCLVPEKREEVTTERGLDVILHKSRIKEFCDELRKSSIQVSLFIDPEINQIDAAANVGAWAVELHTGYYADAVGCEARMASLSKLEKAAFHASSCNLSVNAGHGLDYFNVSDVARITAIRELNIGHSIVAKSVFIGFANAVSKMKHILNSARGC